MNLVSQSIRSHYLIFLLLASVALPNTNDGDLQPILERLALLTFFILFFYTMRWLVRWLTLKLKFERLIHLLWMTSIGFMLMFIVLSKIEWIYSFLMTTIILFYVLYESLFFRRIQNEVIPIYSLVIPIILIVMVCLLFSWLIGGGASLALLLILSMLFFSFHHPQIETRRFYFTIIVLSIIGLPLLAYYFSNFSFSINIAFLQNFSFSQILGKGIGTSYFHNVDVFNLISLNIPTIIYDELGILGKILLNLFPFFIVIYLWSYSNQMDSEVKRLFLRGTALVIFTYILFSFLEIDGALINPTHPLGSFSLSSLISYVLLIISETLISELFDPMCI